MNCRLVASYHCLVLDCLVVLFHKYSDPPRISERDKTLLVVRYEVLGSAGVPRAFCPRYHHLLDTFS